MPSFIAHLENCRSDEEREHARGIVEADLRGAGVAANVEVKDVNIDGQLRIECPDDVPVTLQQIQSIVHHASITLIENEEAYLVDEPIEMMGVQVEPPEGMK